MENPYSADILLLLFFSFLVGGIIKGVIGTGLPTVALALMTATIGIREGMAIILLPSILTNIEQGLLGGELRSILVRSWTFFLATFCTVWIGAAFITRVNIALLSGLLGIILLFHALFELANKRLSPPGTAEPWLNPLIGCINGLLTGLTGSSVVPGVLYLQSLGLGREAFIQTMGLLFLISTTTLAFALQKNELLTPQLVVLSALSFIPAYIGMRIGRITRRRISEKLFRRFFLGFLLFLGLYILIRALIMM